MITFPSLLIATVSAAADAPPAAAADLLSAVASGDLAGARATLAADVVIMDEGSGTPAPSSVEAFAGRVRGCERTELTWDVDAVDPERAAVSVTWTCPSRASAQAFIWTVARRVMHIQFGPGPRQ